VPLYQLSSPVSTPGDYVVADCNLVVRPVRSPFRGWFGSILSAFLRSSPLPVRRWLTAHGVIHSMVRTLVNEHAAKALLSDPAAPVRLATKAAAVAAPDASAPVEGRGSGGGAAETTSSTHPGDCEDEEESPAYDRQACFDVLSECLRGTWSPSMNSGPLMLSLSTAVLSAHSTASHSSIGMATTQSAEPLAGSERACGSPPQAADRQLHSSLLLRLACDHLADSNMFWRSIFTCEDWCYGLCSILPAVGLSLKAPREPRSPVVLPSAPGSWELLASESIRIVAGVSPDAALPELPALLYHSVDGAALAHPLFAFLRRYRVPLLYALMGAVSIENVGHDNLCNLNTALLMFVSAHRHGGLPALVAQLHAYQRAFLPPPPRRM